MSLLVLLLLLNNLNLLASSALITHGLRLAFRRETHDFTTKTETQELSPKKMSCKAEICRRRRGRSSSLHRMQEILENFNSPFQKYKTMENKRDIKGKWKLKRSKGKKQKLVLELLAVGVHYCSAINGNNTYRWDPFSWPKLQICHCNFIWGNG